MGNAKHTKESLEVVIKQCTQWNQVCKLLGVKPFTGAQTHLKKRADAFGIDYTHFGGMGRKGQPRVKKSALEYINTDKPIRSSALREKLISEGILPAACKFCGISEWQGREAPLELDHIDSDHWNNALENLQILCANCHTLKHRPTSPNGEMQTHSS